MAREYAAKITVTYKQLKDMQDAQQAMYEDGIVEPNELKLKKVLEPLSTVLGLAFLAYTAASAAAAVVSLVTYMIGSSEKEMLEDMVYKGYWGMGRIDRTFRENPKFDTLEVKFPFIEYTVNGERIRFVTGNGLITRYHTDGGWSD